MRKTKANAAVPAVPDTALRAEHARLRRFAQLVLRGCESGRIKCAPIISFGKNEASMTSLADEARQALGVVDEAAQAELRG